MVILIHFEIHSFGGNVLKREIPLKTTILLTMSVLKHANYTFPNRKRSKVIMRPEKVEIMHIHFVAQNVSGAEETANGVDINIGLLHHYRNDQSDDHSPV